MSDQVAFGFPQKQVYIMMGVSGCGKTTVGGGLADKLGVAFYDADDYHPPENVVKMSQGIPLNDDDRAPWLNRLHGIIAGHVAEETGAVLACSALKKAYRRRLRGGLERVHFVYLEGNFELIWARMSAREGHFMKAGMLESQFEVLEAPAADEALCISIDQTVEEIMEKMDECF